MDIAFCATTSRWAPAAVLTSLLARLPRSAQRRGHPIICGDLQAESASLRQQSCETQQIAGTAIVFCSISYSYRYCRHNDHENRDEQFANATLQKRSAQL
jgi:hypothetical protein